VSITDQTRTLATGTWNADPVHSELGFSIEYMAGTFRGTFSRFSVKLEDGVLSGSADVASIQVKDPSLEAHLQSPEFFDAERYPQLTFVSRELSREGNRLTIRGEITIKGHTEPVEITGTTSDPITDPWGNERFGLTLEAAVDRTDFDIRWNNPLPTGEPALASEVTIVAELQLVQAA
jgi:polyisoprenoid-binding protein YceI